MNAVLLFTFLHSQLMRLSVPFTSLPPRSFSVYALHYDNQCLVKGKKEKIIVSCRPTWACCGWFISEAEWIYKAFVMWSLACSGIHGKAINHTKWNHRRNKPLIFTYFTFIEWHFWIKERVAAVWPPSLLFIPVLLCMCSGTTRYSFFRLSALCRPDQRDNSTVTV